ncbi:hypothetical protein ACE4ZV_26850 [Salmonella enterica]
MDPCGENGEFHTLVTDCPAFSTPLKVRVIDTWTHEKYCFSKLSLL